MKYKILFEERAQKEFSRISQPYQNLIASKICKIAENFNAIKNQLKPLKGKYDYYRLRVGSYRVLFHKDDNKFIIIIIRIGHRKEIYK